MPIPSALLALPAAAQAATGLYQTIKGSRMKAPQSDATVPAAYQERIKRLKMQEALGSKLPGQDLMENKLTASTASGINAVKEMGNQASFSNNVAQFLQQEQDKLAEIGIAGAKRKDELAAQTNEAIKDLEGYQQGIQARKFAKEEAELQNKLSLTGAGYQNIWGGLTSAASLAATMGTGAGRGARTGAGAGAGGKVGTGPGLTPDVNNTFRRGLSGVL